MEDIAKPGSRLPSSDRRRRHQRRQTRLAQLRLTSDGTSGDKCSSPNDGLSTAVTTAANIHSGKSSAFRKCLAVVLHFLPQRRLADGGIAVDKCHLAGRRPVVSGATVGDASRPTHGSPTVVPPVTNNPARKAMACRQWPVEGKRY